MVTGSKELEYTVQRIGNRGIRPEMTCVSDAVLPLFGRAEDQDYSDVKACLAVSLSIVVSQRENFKETSTRERASGRGCKDSF